MPRIRLDQLIVARGLVPSRARARDAILRGTVSLDGRVIDRPGETIDEAATIVIDDPAAPYVSRAALKLVAGLDAFGFDVDGRACLDIGASTGGFTEVLLDRGARHVTAVDVGHGQMHPRLVSDIRVTLIEGLNARDLTAMHLAELPELIVCDVSFISLTLALPPALALAKPGAFLVALIKPQFEVGRARIRKGGLVDPADGLGAVERIRGWLHGRDGFAVRGVKPAPIAGGGGNLEYLIGAVRG